ncbi:hypothetical protein [Bacillus sp. FJAT-47783]|uniref:hypothetical protein n=1 Tax=Bacillus sp. FJAT-47783 TaxID=2922712 RepID=UPI001FAC769D|nr:hypothetical protein [Bacillus sp. FJAT-47783]
MENLIQTFQKELHKANEEAFKSYIQSFLNLWSYEYNSMANIPPQIEKHLYLSDYDIVMDEERDFPY